MTTLEVDGEVISIPDDASEKVKKAIQVLKTRIAKDAEAKLADIWQGHKSEMEEAFSSLAGDIFASYADVKVTLPSLWLQIKFDQGRVSGAELFTKVTRVRASTGPRKPKASGGNGRKSIRDLVTEKFSQEIKSYTMAGVEYSSPARLLDVLAVPYYKASDPAPHGDAPQREIVKFGRDNPDAAADITINLADGTSITLAEVVSA